MSFGWGIAGTGGIARRVGAVMVREPGMHVAAVASRDGDRAAALAAELGTDHSYGSYEALADDPSVDGVYVATPHTGHAEVAEAALLAGTSVLCEKPLTHSLAESERLVAVARDSGTFLMEAMWMRFNPLAQQLRQLVLDGGLGTPRALWASFGFPAPDDPTSRLWAPGLGGGALLDLGVYTVELARMLLGEPESLVARGSLSATGVDAESSLQSSFPGGACAVLNQSLLARLPGTARLVGSRGFAELGPAFHAATELVVEIDGTPPQRYGNDDRDAGFAGELNEVVRCVEQGRTQSEVATLDGTLATMRLLDQARGQLGS